MRRWDSRIAWLVLGMALGWLATAWFGSGRAVRDAILLARTDVRHHVLIVNRSLKPMPAPGDAGAAAAWQGQVSGHMQAIYGSGAGPFAVLERLDRPRTSLWARLGHATSPRLREQVEQLRALPDGAERLAALRQELTGIQDAFQWDASATVDSARLERHLGNVEFIAGFPDAPLELIKQLPGRE